MALRAQIDPNTVIEGDLNTPLSPTDRSSRQKINKETSELIHTNRHGWYLQSISPNNQAIHILFCSSWNFLQNTSYFRQKASLNKLKKIEITPCIISDHNRLKLDLNNKRNHRKYSNTWRLNNTMLKNQLVTEEIRKEI
jgi:hypothetical protein